MLWVCSGITQRVPWSLRCEGYKNYALDQHGLPLALPPSRVWYLCPRATWSSGRKRHLSCTSLVNFSSSSSSPSSSSSSSVSSPVCLVARLLTLDPSRSLTRPRADQQPFAPNHRLQPTILLAQSLILTPRPYPPARSPSAPASRRFRRFLALTTAQHEL